METIKYNNIEEITQYLPSNWKQLAKETNAFTRARNIKTPEDLLALNMLYITNEGSFQITSAIMKIARGISVNKNAVYERITGSGEWLRQMAEALCQKQSLGIKKPEFLGDKHVKLIDASDETTKGKNKTIWRLHYVFDLFEFTATSIELTTNKKGEKLTNHVISDTDIIVADRVYCTMSGIEHVLSNNGDFIIRFKSKAFHLYDETGNRLELLPYFRHLGEYESTTVNCYYKINGELRPLRIVAMKKDATAIAESKRKMEQKVSKKQEQEVYPDTVELNEYVVLATSVNYTNEQILELYRARWQIEQVFYRLKSLFGYGEVPSKNEKTVKAWFYGKLFFAALCENILKQSSFSP